MSMLRDTVMKGKQLDTDAYWRYRYETLAENAVAKKMVRDCVSKEEALSAYRRWVLAMTRHDLTLGVPSVALCKNLISLFHRSDLV